MIGRKQYPQILQTFLQLTKLTNSHKLRSIVKKGAKSALNLSFSGQKVEKKCRFCATVEKIGAHPCCKNDLFNAVFAGTFEEPGNQIGISILEMYPSEKSGNYFGQNRLTMWGTQSVT